ncbi:MAG TPA: hypothetical protein VJ251_11610 [Stellaceae bacterium]|jgi:hypothetical protein|nr:hypothetical protein [Stellaceae bacterium]
MQGICQLLQLLRQLGARFRTAIQMLALGFLGDPSGEQLESADNNLQRLA